MPPLACPNLTLPAVSWLTLPLGTGLLITRAFFAARTCSSRRKKKVRIEVLLFQFVSVLSLLCWILYEAYALSIMCFIPYQCTRLVSRSRYVCWTGANSCQYYFYYLRKRSLCLSGQQAQFLGGDTKRNTMVWKLLRWCICTNTCVAVYVGVTMIPGLSEIDFLAETMCFLDRRTSLLVMAYSFFDLIISCIYTWLFLKPFLAMKNIMESQDAQLPSVHDSTLQISRRKRSSVSVSSAQQSLNMINLRPLQNEQVKKALKRVLRGFAVSQVAQTSGLICGALLPYETLRSVTRITTFINILGIFMMFPDARYVTMAIFASDARKKAAAASLCYCDCWGKGRRKKYKIHDYKHDDQ